MTAIVIEPFVVRHDPQSDMTASFGVDVDDFSEKFRNVILKARDTGVGTLSGLIMVAAEELEGVEFLLTVEGLGANYA